MDLCGLLEMDVKGLHVFDGLFAFLVRNVRGWQAGVAFYLCPNGYWVMGIEEVVNGIVVGVVRIPGLAAMLFYNVLGGNCGLSVGLSILLIGCSVQISLH